VLGVEPHSKSSCFCRTILSNEIPRIRDASCNTRENTRCIRDVPASHTNIWMSLFFSTNYERASAIALAAVLSYGKCAHHTRSDPSFNDSQKLSMVPFIWLHSSFDITDTSTTLRNTLLLFPICRIGNAPSKLRRNSVLRRI
jgi:hypothetical protein